MFVCTEPFVFRRLVRREGPSPSIGRASRPGGFAAGYPTRVSVDTTMTLASCAQLQARKDGVCKTISVPVYAAINREFIEGERPVELTDETNATASGDDDSIPSAGLPLVLVAISFTALIGAFFRRRV